MNRKQPIFYLCSDALGDTAEMVVKATMQQFAVDEVNIKRYHYIQTEEEIYALILDAQENGGIVAYTLVEPNLREVMKRSAIEHDVQAIDIIGPLMQAYIDTFNDSPKEMPGLQYELDAKYYNRIEAIDFAVKYDDGKNIGGLLAADIVLVGVSRTSKTPLSIYLAHKGIKVANLPLIPGIAPPSEIFTLQNTLIVGLTMDPNHLLKVRTERLKVIGLPNTTSYTEYEPVKSELNYGNMIMKQLMCPVINVSNKSIEEAAVEILGLMNKK
ncbi:phosphotransferase [Alkalihalobacillus alcalophilus ATCC 27647 = CGMCC 1.3604]|uniref:Putative pyruvate, phosphate dikinase regulatory protein n=1 Tax=Alkalihalobacillus alcalophilus ATCC 27647 = CGMCC 1.3604 TaxID=1218173 RepID=A0A094WMB9_ALKAL|nr:pyruvate, water dikinase regulatory protein [Alkalihalobacillus alcalophilus]KGA98894.1 phosphotransferase [Alkalihalobacillus alcalophilus ATCC 27647 = CGMCC 1.3604]MED1560532.1 kinase/pyrophosphorylase [Alkalihalobacillus alcalophilus]THG88880.1 phosphotransferase [Alkalihalobacillus alcalophilus ATCC 27647 = CGMCC 1.3604]